MPAKESTALDRVEAVARTETRPYMRTEAKTKLAHGGAAADPCRKGAPHVRVDRQALLEIVMKNIRFGLPVVLFALTVSALGCGGDDDDGSSGSPGRGIAEKGEPCSRDLDCASPASQCAQGGICTGDLGGDAFETECTEQSFEACAGQTCIVLNTNVQNKTGICSLSCSIDEDCGGSAVCLNLGLETNLCFSVCDTSADCSNGFACIEGMPRNVCLVEVMM